MSDFWGKRWVDAVWNKTKALFNQTAQPENKQQPEEKQLIEQSLWTKGTGWLKAKRKPILGTIATVGALGTIVTTSVLGHIYVKENTNEILHVYVGDTEIGAVSDREVVRLFLKEKSELVGNLYPNIHMELEHDPVTFQSERGFKLRSDDEDTLDRLAKYLSTKTTGTEIWIAGEMVGLVKDETEAEKLLEQYQEKYLPLSMKSKSVQTLSAQSNSANEGEGTQLAEVKFLEEVELRTTTTTPEHISTKTEIIHKLEVGDTKPLRYSVQKGDCISCIAAKFDVTTDFIYENNPGLKDDLLQIGDQIDLTVQKPALSVQTIEQQKVVETIPHGVVYEDDPEMRKGLQEVVTAGVDGKKRVEYELTRINGVLMDKKAIEEQILDPPQPKIIKRGTKVIKGIGTGTFRWPVAKARVTSHYGKRWGSSHNGTDMVSSNRTIMAADSGTVTFAGRKNGYGNTIIIDHKNGYETLYAHLSKASVSKGTKVEKGSSIGTMGNTGNSHGVHLHFEVIKNGKHQNPIDYLP